MILAQGSLKISEGNSQYLKEKKMKSEFDIHRALEQEETSDSRVLLFS